MTLVVETHEGLLVTGVSLFFLRSRFRWMESLLQIEIGVGIGVGIVNGLLTTLQSTPLCRSSIHFLDELIFTVHISIYILRMLLR